MLLITSWDVGDAIPYNIAFSVWSFIDSLRYPQLILRVFFVY